jgi:hemolysin activation/secretion protein
MLRFELNTKHFLVKKTAVLLLGVCSLYGAPDAIDSAKPPSQVQTKPEELAITQSKVEFALESGGRVFVKDFEVEGALKDDTFGGILSAYKNRELNMREINEAAAKITQHYKAKGYITANALVLEQNMQEDILKITVVIGKYGGISYENKSPIMDFVIRNTLETSLKKGGYVTNPSLERAMLLISDLAGANLPKVTIMPGSEFGSSDFNFDLESEKRLEGYITGDNYGSRLTGKKRLSIGLDINSPFGLADKLSFSGLQSEGAELQDGRAAYSFPLYSNGLRGEISAQKSDYELGQEYRDLEAVGTAKVLSASLSYPIIRTQAENLYVRANFAKKEMKDKIQALNNVIPKEINVVALGLSYEKYTTIFGLNAFYGAGLNLNFGRLEITDEKEKALNKKGANTVGGYSKTDISFLGSIALSESFMLTGNFRAQKVLNNKNIDGSEQISISGTSGVRAYPDSEYSADNGYVIGAELAYKIPEIVGISQNVGVFFDIGRSFIENNGYTTAKDRTLSDIGLSYNIRYKDIFGSFKAAKIVGGEKVLSEDDYETRYLCQIGAIF